MPLRTLIAAWNEFFFKPELPTPISLFRMVYGAMVIFTLTLLRPDWLAWFGPRAWISLATIRRIEPGVRLNLFTVIPQTDLAANALFWVFLLAAICLTAGFFTRASTIVVFLCLTSIHQRNLYINHGGDTFLRIAGFFLIFAPAGAAFSLDRLIRIRRGKEPLELQPRSPWALRMIQFELALVYFSSFWWKSMGAPWIEGTALYYVLHLEEIRRFPVPQWFQNPVILKLGCWFTLALECSLGVLIWIKEFRYPLLLLGLGFHLSIEYALNIPMFEWDILSGYILFIDPADLARAARWLGRRVPAAKLPLIKESTYANAPARRQ